MSTYSSGGAGNIIEAISHGLWHATMLPGEPAHSPNPLIDVTLPHPAKTTNEQRIVLERLLGIDQPAEQLIVASGAHSQGATDRLLLGAAVTGPCRLEREDRAVAICEVSEHDYRLWAGSPFCRAPLPPSAQ